MNTSKKPNGEIPTLSFSEQDAFRILAEASVHSSDVQDMCKYFLRGLLDVMGFEFGGVRIYNANTGMLDLVAWEGFEERYLPDSISIGSFEQTGFLISHVAFTQKPIFIPGEVHDVNLRIPPRIMKRYHLSTYTAWPIMHRNELIGTMSVATQATIRFSKRARQFFDTILALFATAVRNRQSEMQIRQTEEFQNQVLSAIHGSAIIVVDKKLTPVKYWVDKQLLKKYQLGLNEIIQCESFKFKSTKRRKKFQNIVREVFKTQSLIREEFIGTPPGGEFWFDITLSPIIDENGHVQHVVIFVQDITSIKTIESKLRGSYKDLELYTSLLKHDILNDLQILQSLFESIEIMYPDDNRLRELVAQSKISIGQMTKMLDIIDIRHLNTRTDLIQIIKETIKNFRRTLIRSKLVIDDEVYEHKLTVGRLIQVVLANVIRNAAKYAGPEPTVTIHVYIKENSIVIDMTDNGPGIPPEIKPRLFRKGVSTSGSGLGLYLCRKVVEGYGGSFTLIPDNELDQGAGFRIVLPLNEKTA